MNEIRKRRLESLIIRELSELIQKRRVKDERIGFVSVTRCNLLPDMSGLTVFISLFGEESENRETWKALVVGAPYFQSTMSRNLRLRQTPKIRFELDDSIQEGDRILNIIESGQ